MPLGRLYYPGGKDLTKIDMLVSEVQQAPDEVLDEVLDFVRFIKARRLQGIPETAWLRAPNRTG